MLIANERRRQIRAEGWTPEHDDEHVDGELCRAAACYAQPPERRGIVYTGLYADPRPVGWPWHPSWWKPSPDRVRELVKAGALIAAEIDRNLRAGVTTAARRAKTRAADHDDHDIHGPVIQVWPDRSTSLDPDCDCPPGCAQCAAEGIERAQ